MRSHPKPIPNPNLIPILQHSLDPDLDPIEQADTKRTQILYFSVPNYTKTGTPNDQLKFQKYLQVSVSTHLYQNFLPRPPDGGMGGMM